VHTYGLRFDVNCSILFTERPLLKRPAWTASSRPWIGCEYKPSDPADSATSFAWR
jgi:hydroxypyruvate isomerase